MEQNYKGRETTAHNNRSTFVNEQLPGKKIKRGHPFCTAAALLMRESCQGHQT